MLFQQAAIPFLPSLPPSCHCLWGVSVERPWRRKMNGAVFRKQLQIPGGCPARPRAGSLPTSTARWGPASHTCCHRTDLTRGTDGGNRAMGLPCPQHSRDTSTCNPTPLATRTLERVELLCCTPYLVFCSVFKCHVYPSQTCCCVCYTDFLWFMIFYAYR